MLENDFVQISIVLLFNPAEPETSAKENPRALKMMKLVSLFVILSFLGVFAQDREIANNPMMMNPCYPKCSTELDKCKEFYKCSLQRWRCFDYCTEEYYRCMECKF